MPATYKDFYREPSKPHQCMHSSEKDGTRCRASAMHNHFMCYHHHDDDIPTVIQNDLFLIEALDTRAAVQKALTDVAARLACNHIDLKRAGLLLQAIQIASTNLRNQSQPDPPTAEEADTSTEADPAAPQTNVISTEGDPASTQTSVMSTEGEGAVEKPALSVPKGPSHFASAAQPAINNRPPRSQRNRRRRTTH